MATGLLLLAAAAGLLSLAKNEYKAAKVEAGQQQELLLATGLLQQLERKYEKNQVVTGVSDWRDEYTPTSPVSERQSWRLGVYGKLPEVVWLVAESRSSERYSSVERGYFSPPGGAALPAYQQALYAGQGIKVGDHCVTVANVLSGGQVLMGGEPVKERSLQSCVLVEPTWSAYTRGVGFPTGSDWQGGGLSGQIYNGYLTSSWKMARFYPMTIVGGDGVFVNPDSIDIGEKVVFSGRIAMVSKGAIIIRDQAKLACAFLYAQKGITFGNQVTFSGVAITPAAIVVGGGCQITWNASALQTRRTPILMNGKELVFWN